MIRGVLFDLDGTLADTEPLQWQAYRTVLAAFAVDVGIDEYRHHWIAVEGGAEYACRTYRLPIDATELRARKTVEYRRLITAGVAPRPGARAVLERLGLACRLAVATNTVRTEAELVLGHLGVREIQHVRTFGESPPEVRLGLSAPTLGALTTAGLANPTSAWDAIGYEPTVVCEAFLRLALDR